MGGRVAFTEEAAIVEEAAVVEAAVVEAAVVEAAAVKALISRRWFLTLVPVSGALLGCQGVQSCLPPAPSSLNEQDLQARENAGYRHQSSLATQSCDRCVQFISGEGCGTCKVLPGSFNPKGTCKLFAPAG